MNLFIQKCILGAGLRNIVLVKKYYNKMCYINEKGKNYFEERRYFKLAYIHISNQHHSQDIM